MVTFLTPAVIMNSGTLKLPRNRKTLISQLIKSVRKILSDKKNVNHAIKLYGRGKGQKFVGRL